MDLARHRALAQAGEQAAGRPVHRVVEYAVQEYVAPDTGGYWMAAWTSVDEARARGRLVDCRRVHGVERSFRLVELVTTKTVRVIEP